MSIRQSLLLFYLHARAALRLVLQICQFSWICTRTFWAPIPPIVCGCKFVNVTGCKSARFETRFRLKSWGVNFPIRRGVNQLVFSSDSAFRLEVVIPQLAGV